MRDGKRSRLSFAVLVVGCCCSLGAGPWRCSLRRSLDAVPGLAHVAAYVAGYAAGYAAGAGAGPGPGPGLPVIAAVPAPGADAGRRSIPPRPPAVAPPGRPAAPPAAPAITAAPRRDEPTARELHGPPRPAPPALAVVPDEIVVTAVRALQPTFVACWRRAQRGDPTLVSARVRISLELDGAGAVTAARTDADDPRLSRCLASVARSLAFPALGRPAALEIPLYF